MLNFVAKKKKGGGGGGGAGPDTVIEEIRTGAATPIGWSIMDLNRTSPTFGYTSTGRKLSRPVGVLLSLPAEQADWVV